VALNDEFVEVVSLGRVQRSKGEVVQDEQVDAGQAAHLGVEGVIQADTDQLIGQSLQAASRVSPAS
jgi:hypothetical protein